MGFFRLKQKVRHTRSGQAEYIKADTPNLGGAEDYIYQPPPGSQFLPMTLWGNSIPCGDILPRIFTKPLFVPNPAIPIANFGGVPAGTFVIEELPEDQQYFTTQD